MIFILAWVDSPWSFMSCTKTFEVKFLSPGTALGRDAAACCGEGGGQVSLPNSCGILNNAKGLAKAYSLTLFGSEGNEGRVLNVWGCETVHYHQIHESSIVFLSRVCKKFLQGEIITTLYRMWIFSWFQELAICYDLPKFVLVKNLNLSETLLQLWTLPNVGTFSHIHRNKEQVEDRPQGRKENLSGIKCLEFTLCRVL